MTAALTDTHCHLYFRDFNEDLAEVLNRAWDQGVQRILIPGIDLATSRQAVALAENHPNLYAAVGIHPNDSLAWDDTTADQLRELAAHPKTLAIGEIGLDFYRDRAPKTHQIEVFKAQLALAAECSLPVVIHNRQAIAAVWPILQAWQEQLAAAGSPLAARPGVLHSFDESFRWAEKAISSNFYIGISGPVTFRKATEKHELVQHIPLTSLLIETDAPFLTPHPFRGRRNEPAYTSYIAEKIATLKNIAINEVQQQTYENAAALFGWPP
ncbi:MAG: TatD family hydrolase [Anaerolineaceae bacterium]|jgi:TatD DNase family protein|nr:TatD family hydrolase [Anaerolineaceae bacterium]